MAPIAEAGNVWVTVLPSMRGFVSKVNAELKSVGDVKVNITADAKKLKADTARAAAEAKATVQIDADISDVKENIREFEAEIADLNKKLAADTPQLDLDIRAAEAKADKLVADLERLRSMDPNPEVELKTAKAEADLGRLTTELDGLRAKKVTPEVAVQLEAAERNLDGFRATLDRLSTKRIDIVANLDVDTGGALAKLKAFREVAGRGVNSDLDLNIGGALGKIAMVNAALLAIPAAAGGAAYSVGSIGAALAPAVGLAGLLPAGILGAGLAMGTLKVATSGVGDAIKNAFDPTKAKQFQQALAQLSPEAKTFVLALQGIKPQLDAVKNATQDAFFAGLGPMLTSLAGSVLPIVQGGFVRVAASINDAATATGGWLQSTYGVGVLHALVDGLSTAFSNVAQAGAPLVTSFITIGAIGAPILAQLTQGAGAVAGKFASWVGSAQGIQTIHDMIKAGIAVLQQLWTVVSNVGSILWSVITAANQAGSNFLGTLGDLTGQVAAFLKSGEGQTALASLFQNIRAAVTAAMPGVQALLGALGGAITQLAPVLPSVGAAFSSVMIAAKPLFDLLVSLAAAVLPPLLGLITQYPGAFIGAGIAVFGLVKAFQAASAVSKLLKTELFGVQVAALLFGDTTRTGLIPAIGQGVVRAVTAAWGGLVTFAGFIWSTVLPAIGAWIVETWAQAAAMLAAYWPVLAIIAVIGLLVAAVWLIVANWSTISGFFVNLWNIVSGAFVTAWNAIWGFLVGVWNAIWGTVVTVWGAILGFFSMIWNAIWGVVMTVWNAIVGWLTAMFYVHYDLWMQIWGAIYGFFSTIWNFIAGVAMAVWNAISAFFVGAFNVFVAFFTAVWNGIVAVFTAVWNWIRSVAMTVWNAIAAYFSAAFAAYAAFFSAVWNGIVAVFTTVWNWLSNIAITVWNAIVAFLMPAINAFAAFFSMIWNAISSFFSMIWGAISNTAVSWWNTISGFFTGAFAAFAGFFTGVWNGIKDTFVRIWQSISDEAGRIWNGIVGVVKGAVNGVIDAANWMTDKINVVLRFLLIPTIPAIPRLEAGGIIGLARGGALGAADVQYAAQGTRIGGGFVTNGPRVVVGEGKPAHPEYVVPTDPAYRGRALSLHASLSADLGLTGGAGAAGMPPMGGPGAGLSIGGIIGDVGSWIGDRANDVGDFASGAWKKLTDAIADVAQWIGDPLNALKAGTKGALNALMPAGIFHDAGNWMVDKVFDAVSQKIQAAQAAMSGASIGPMSASHALDIVNAAKSKGIPHAGAVIAIMTGLQESGLRILANPAVPASMALPHEGVGHDHDSVGIFQQRQSWGPTALLMNPFGSAQLFYNKLGRGPYGDYGAEAQRVQVSAFPGAYSKWRGAAEGLVGGTGFDAGGVASGTGLLAKQIISPERVLSPRQTQAFEALVPLLASMRTRRAAAGLDPSEFATSSSSDARSPRPIVAELYDADNTLITTMRGVAHESIDAVTAAISDGRRS